MSNGTTPQQVPLSLSVAPFPEGFSGDMDETWQQGTALIEAYMEGNFLFGLVLPPGSTLPNTDQGVIFMGGQWYFWDTTTGQYLPQSSAVKVAANYCKNAVYQVAQTGSSFPNLAAGVTKTYDMALARSTLANVLGITPLVGPPSSAYNDQIGSAINYTVGSVLVASPAATDLYAHEHLVEGSDLAPAQGQLLTLSFWAYSNVTGKFSGYITSSGRDCSYVFTFQITAANTWTRVVIPGIPKIPTTIGTWNFAEGATGCYIGVGMAVGSQWSSSAPGSWQNGFFATTSGVMTNFCAVTNNQLAVTGFKLEASSTATYLTVKSFESDLHDAIRYYSTSFNYQVTNAGVPLVGNAPLAAQYLFSTLFPRRMAKVPTVVPYSSTSPAAGSITDVSGGYNVSLANLAATQKGINGSGSLTLATTGTTNSTVNITAIPSTTGLAVGMGVTGTGIPAGATIASIVSGSAITISAAATASGANVALTFNLVTKGDILACYVTADARLS